jgi:DNA-binding transcriptional LysR family regulator
MVLTPMGEAFVRRATAVLSEVRRARDEVEQLHGGTRGRVVAGLSLAAHVALLPKALKPAMAMARSRNCWRHSSIDRAGSTAP